MSRALAVVRGRDRELADLETDIELLLTSFVNAGKSLWQIRQDRVYERDGYKTFEEYCTKRWRFSKRRANQLIAAADVMDRIEFGNNCSRLSRLSRLPENEAQARALSALPENEQREAWIEIVETAPNGVITAKHVRSVVATRRPAQTNDATGDAEAPSPLTGEHITQLRETLFELVEWTVRSKGDPGPLEDMLRAVLERLERAG